MNDNNHFADHAGKTHRNMYGKSDKLNSPDNSNREFQEGYRVGANSMCHDAEQVINEEFHLRVEVGDDLCEGFDEWKRGFWGARSQCILFVSKRRKMVRAKFFGEREGR